MTTTTTTATLWIIDWDQTDRDQRWAACEEDKVLPASCYRKHTVEVERTDGPSDREQLDAIFERMNIGDHFGIEGPSMSAGDLVTVDDVTWHCSRIGWTVVGCAGQPAPMPAPAPKRKRRAAERIVNRVKTCRCGCCGRDPWHRRDFRRVVADQHDAPAGTRVQVAAFPGGDYRATRIGVVTLPWAHVTVAQIVVERGEVSRQLPGWYVVGDGSIDWSRVEDRMAS